MEVLHGFLRCVGYVFAVGGFMMFVLIQHQLWRDGVYNPWRYLCTAVLLGVGIGLLACVGAYSV